MATTAESHTIEALHLDDHAYDNLKRSASFLHKSMGFGKKKTKIQDDDEISSTDSFLKS